MAATSDAILQVGAIDLEIRHNIDTDHLPRIRSRISFLEQSVGTGFLDFSALKLNAYSLNETLFG